MIRLPRRGKSSNGSGRAGVINAMEGTNVIIEMTLSEDNLMVVKSIQSQIKDGIFTTTYRHDFQCGKRPDPSEAVNILLTSMP